MFVLQLLFRLLSSRRVLAFLFLLFGMASVAWGLASIEMVKDSGAERLMFWLTVAGVLLGWAAAGTRWPAWFGLPASALIGSAGLLLNLGRLDAPLLNVFAKFPPLFLQLLNWRYARLDWLPLNSAWKLFVFDFNRFLARIETWIERVSARQPASDPLIIAAFWGLAILFTSLWAAWAVRRCHSPLLGVVPGGALLAAVLNFQGLDPYPLLLVVGAGLLLMALLHYDASERRWLANGMDFAGDLALDTSVAVTLLAAAILLLAAFAPAVSIDAVVNYARRFSLSGRAQEDAGDQVSLGQSLGLQQPVVTVRPRSFEVLRLPRLPREHLLGAGPELSRIPVMTVRVLSPAYAAPPFYSPFALQQGYQPPPRYYWRMVTYDRYTGRGWGSDVVRNLSYQPAQPAFNVLPPNQQVISQTVTVEADLGGMLLAAGVTLRAAPAYEVAWRSLPVSDTASVDAFSAADLFGAVIGATDDPQDASYQVESAVTAARLQQLRASPAEYPAWVSKRYLALPENLPIRVRELGFAIAAGQPTPYDKARAIELYLRQIPYTLDVPAPPTDRDVADFFLFDLQKGYCDYYATAMAVLARSVGLPARLVTGFASGAYDPVQNVYRVVEADAHSWVEIYFPEVGWVEFEPTAAQPEIERPQEAESGQSNLPIPLPPAQSGETMLWEQRLRGYVFLGGLGLLLLGALAVQGMILFQFIEGWWWMRLPPEQAIPRIYRRLYQMARPLEHPADSPPVRPSVQPARRLSLHAIQEEMTPASEVYSPGAASRLTPTEFAVHLKAYFERLAARKYLGQRFRPAAAEIQQLTALYIQTIYSAHPPSAAECRAALQTWRSLRGRLRLARWLARLERLAASGLRKIGRISIFPPQAD